MKEVPFILRSNITFRYDGLHNAGTDHCSVQQVLITAQWTGGLRRKNWYDMSSIILKFLKDIKFLIGQIGKKRVTLI